MVCFPPSDEIKLKIINFFEFFRIFSSTYQNLVDLLLSCSVGDFAVNETLRKLDKFSVRIEKVSSDINGLVEDTMDKSADLIQSNHEWCAVAVNLFPLYLQQLQNASKDEAMKQHRIVIPVLENGFKKITAAQKRLEEIWSSFSEASGRNITLSFQINGEFNEYRDHYVYKLNQHLQSDEAGSIRCMFWICSDTSLTYHIRSMLDEIAKKMEKVRKDLDTEFKNSDPKINETRAKLKREVVAISDVKSQAQITLDTIKDIIEVGAHDSVIINEIKISAEKLIKECQNYKARHET